jgi:hypothetical protein
MFVKERLIMLCVKPSCKMFFDLKGIFNIRERGQKLIEFLRKR